MSELERPPSEASLSLPLLRLTAAKSSSSSLEWYSQKSLTVRMFCSARREATRGARVLHCQYGPSSESPLSGGLVLLLLLLLLLLGLRCWL